MTEALRDIPPSEQQPFADEKAGMAYFESEAHYRSLAATLRDALQQHQILLVTGNPAPNGELLIRHLCVDVSPRYRATAIKGNAQMSFDGVMNSYRKLLGISIAEETLKRAAGPPQPVALARGNERDILVLENADALADEVLDELCMPAAPEEHRPAMVFLAKDGFLDRLSDEALDAVNDALPLRLSLQSLAPHETEPFIRSQLESAHLDEAQYFKAPILELISLYADGSPLAVNELARRVVEITQQTRARAALREAEEFDEPLPEPAVVHINSVAMEEAPPAEDIEAPPSEAPLAAEAQPIDEVGAMIEETPAAEEPAPFIAEPAPVVAEELPAPEVAAPTVVKEAELPAEQPPIEETALETSEETAAPAWMERAPREEIAPVRIATVAASIKAESPASSWTVELPRGFDAVDEAPLAPPSVTTPAEENPQNSDRQEEDKTSATVAAAAPLADEAAAPMESAPVDAIETEESETEEEAIPVAAAEMPAPAVNETSLDEEEAEVSAEAADTRQPATAEEPALRVIEYPRPHYMEEAASESAEAATSDSAWGPRSLRRMFATAFIVVLAGIALVVGFKTGHLEGLDALRVGDRLTDMMNSAEALRQRVATFIASPVRNTASVPMPESATPQPQTAENPNAELRQRADGDARGASEPKVASPPAAPPPAAASAPVATPAQSAPAAPAQSAAAPSPPSEPSNQGRAVAPSLPPEAPAAPPAEAAQPPAQAAPAPALKPYAPPKREVAVAPAPTRPNPNPTPAPAAPPPGSAAAPAVDNNQLLGRGDQLLASGDIIAARHYFELVIEAGDQRAALRLGKTYDPSYLKQIGARGIAGDPSLAKSWYLKAIASGDKDADLRLLQLMALYPE